MSTHTNSMRQCVSFNDYSAVWNTPFHPPEGSGKDGSICFQLGNYPKQTVEPRGNKDAEKVQSWEKRQAQGGGLSRGEMWCVSRGVSVQDPGNSDGMTVKVRSSQNAFNHSSFLCALDFSFNFDTASTLWGTSLLHWWENWSFQRDHNTDILHAH